MEQWELESTDYAQMVIKFVYMILLKDLSENKDKLENILNRLVEKERISSREKDEILNRINFSKKLEDVKGSSFVIEAIIENLKIKQNMFTQIEDIVDEKCIIATNTSSLSIATITGVCKYAKSHWNSLFQSKIALMPLVEIIPGCSNI